MLRLLRLVALALFVSSCATDDGTKSVIGTNAVLLGEKYDVVADIQISELRVRHVKSAYPQEHCSSPNQVSHHLEVSGPINSDTPLIIERLLKNIETEPNPCTDRSSGKKFATVVYLSSGGGYLDDGLSLGRLLRRETVATIVTYGAKCFSSCATAFLGGRYRKMSGDGQLLFHAPYTPNSFGSINCQSNNNELQKYFVNMIGEKNGEIVYDRTMRNCSANDGWTINADAARLLGITT